MRNDQLITKVIDVLLHIFTWILAAQCEFSFSKAEIVMEMNRLEMERYEILYK